jgi:hypothetical protein
LFHQIEKVNTIKFIKKDNLNTRSSLLREDLRHINLYLPHRAPSTLNPSFNKIRQNEHGRRRSRSNDLSVKSF